jgi:chromodomain-helicase-DNA-binding protein 1
LDEPTLSTKVHLLNNNNNNNNNTDSNLETIEKVLKTRQGRVGATGSKTAIYNIDEDLTSETQTQQPPPPPPPQQQQQQQQQLLESQYLIKWLNWSHLHNTWETKDSLMLQRAKGMKKLDNFLKKRTKSDSSSWKRRVPRTLSSSRCKLK